jgi:hypothetical protein
MNHICMRPLWFLVPMALLPLCGSASSDTLVTRIDGTVPSFVVDSPNPNDPTSASLRVGPTTGVSNSFDLQQGPQSIPTPVGPFPTSFSDFDILDSNPKDPGITGTFIPARSEFSPAFFAWNVGQATPEDVGTFKRIFNLPNAPPAGPGFDAQANFVLSDITALSPLVGPRLLGSNILIVQGDEAIGNNPSGVPESTFDFHGLRFFSMTLVAPEGVNMTELIEDGGHVEGFSGSFVESTSDSIKIPVPVPEPSTWAMMLLGFAGLGFAGYRHARRARLALAA